MTATIISRASDCSVRTFIKCKFDKDYSGLVTDGEATEQELKDAWENINVEYIDTAGIEIPELDLMKSVHELSCRVEAVKAYLLIQQMWTSYESFFSEPPEIALKAIDNLKTYGYRLNWDGNNELFIKQVNSCILKEKKKHVELEHKKKQLEDFYKAQDQADTNPAVKKTINNSRIEFIKLITQLQEHAGYQINQDKTTVEELAVMIRNLFEYIEAAKSKN